MLAAAPFPARALLSPSSSSSASSARQRRVLRARCAAGEEKEGDVQGFLGQQVEALLRKDENRPLFDRLQDASARVDAARAALADIARQEADAARAKDLLLRLQARQSEIAETETALLEARAMVEEAERSLTSSMGGANEGEINRDQERLESVKAGAISAIVGTLACLPISAYQATSVFQAAAQLGVVFLSCALFGITFRYTVRRDLDDAQLKTGTCAAFGFVKGLSAVEYSSSFSDLAINGAVQVSESVFVFLFSAVALDFCFKTGLLSPFPTRK
ncbi:homer protein [Wolffia australiana]